MEVITTHTSCDFDGLASMIAAKKLYPKAKVFFSSSPSQEVRDFMHLYGELLPVEKKIDKISLEKVKRLILVDTRWVDRIGVFGEIIKRKNVEIHVYDHHPFHPEAIKGSFEVCREVGAATSILVDIIKKRGIYLSPFEATLFTLGIYEDTGSLSFSSTTSFDLEAVSYLLDRRANLEFISTFLSHTLTEKQFLLLKEFLEKAKTIYINGVEVVIVKARVEGFVGGISAPLQKFVSLKNPDVVFAIVGSGEKVYVMARSRLPFVNVDEILTPLGGGGHSLAASALLKDVDLREVEEKLEEILRKKISAYFTVGKIIPPFFKKVSPETSLKKVKEILDKEGLQVLPVEDKGRIIGVISKRQVENAIKHASFSSSIKGYYSRKIVSIPPSFSLKKVQQLMMQEEVPWVLVFDKDKFQGIVTSLDVFNAFYLNPPSGENLSSLLKKKVPAKVMDVLFEAGKLAQSLNFSVFIVGGFVRDLLLGKENFDIDLSVEGDGIFFAKKLAEKLKAHLTLHPEFGTATLYLGEGFKLDIATSRREFYPRPGALPRVEPACLKEDLFRRDFTVNAMAISINPYDFGRLIDFFGGKEDIENARVKVLHSKSFVDDPTRIFRAIRFEQRYGFKIDKDTENLIKEAVEKNFFRYVSGKRIKEELVQILEEDRPDKNLKRIKQLGILKIIHPKLKFTSCKERLLDHLVDAIATYELLTGKESKRWLVKLCLLFERVTREEVEDFCKKYSFTREEKETLLTSCKEWRKIVKALAVPKIRPSSICFLLDPFPPETLIFTMARTKSKIVKKRIIFYLSHLQKIKLETTGEDLKKLGYRPSPEFSRILEEVKRAKLDGIIGTKEEEIEFIRKNFPPGRYK